LTRPFVTAPNLYLSDIDFVRALRNNLMARFTIVDTSILSQEV
jgi:hypothetical protein